MLHLTVTPPGGIFNWQENNGKLCIVIQAKDKLYTNIQEPASMFEANAKLPKTMGLVSTLLYFPQETNKFYSPTL